MSKNVLYTGIGVAVALILAGYFFFYTGNNPMTQTASQNSSGGSSSVIIQEVKQGTGAGATPGTMVSVNYVGKLQNGTIFDQSSSHGGPIQFVLGAGQVIPGWEQGIQGMQVGGERVLIIPPSLGYGAQDIKDSQGNIVIPANSQLIFDVTLVGVSTSTNQMPVGAEGPSAN